MDAIVFLVPRIPLPPSMTRQSPFWLLPVANRPLLFRMLDGLAAAGMSRCFLLHAPEDLEAIERIRGKGPEGMAIEWQERGPGALMEILTRMRAQLGENFLVLPFPHLLGSSLAKLVEEHQRLRYAITIPGAPAESAQGARPRAGSAKPVSKGAKIFCCNQAVLGLPAALHCDDFPCLVTALHNSDARIGICEAPGTITPMEGLADLHAGTLRLLRQDPHGEPQFGVRLEPGIYVGEGCRIHPSARLRAPVLLGAGCYIGPHTEVGPDACLAPRTVVEAAAIIHSTVVLPDSVIGPGHHVEKAVVQSGVMTRMADQATTLAADPHFLDKSPAEPPSDALNVPLQRVLAACLVLLFSPILLYLYARHAATPRKRLLSMTTVLGESYEDESGRRTVRRFRMRTCSLDGPLLRQLPALLDVVQGRLRLVGVEPLPTRSGDLLREPWHQIRFHAPVGLIRPWVRLRGVSLSFTQKRVVEQHYALMRSMRMDLRIILAAARFILLPRETRREDEAPVSLKLPRKGSL